MDKNRIAGCPACGQRISFRQIVLGAEGHAIVCRSCSAHLMKKTRAIAPAAFGGIAAWTAADTYGWLSWQFWFAFAGVLLLVTFLALMTVRVRLATAADHGPVEIPPAEVFSGKPPPLDPTFRGMSEPRPNRSSTDAKRPG